MGCCISPRADDGSQDRGTIAANGNAKGAQSRRFDDEDDAFYDCYSDDFGGDDASTHGSRRPSYSEAATVSPSSLGGPHPCEPLDDDEDVPPLPPGVELSPEERRAALAAMRASILGGPDTAAVAPWEDRSPATLERFLRARDYDVAVASALFLEHRAWRQSFGWRVEAAQVTDEQFGQHKICLQARSVDDRPLLVIVVRRHSVVGRDMDVVKAYIVRLPSSRPASLCRRMPHSLPPGPLSPPHQVHTMDRIFDSMRPGGQFLVLVDFKGMSRANIDLKALIACFDILQKYYVERLKHLWFVEPPLIFWAVWKAVQPFVAPKTREKIVFLYGPEVAQTMRHHFKKDDIPAEYGGTGEHRPLSPAPCVWEHLPGAPRRRRY